MSIETEREEIYQSYLNNYLALGLDREAAEKAASKATKYHFRKTEDYE